MKIDRKKNKLIERINELEAELRESLTKKTSDTKEINVPLQQRKIQELKIELNKMQFNARSSIGIGHVTFTDKRGVRFPYGRQRLKMMKKEKSFIEKISEKNRTEIHSIRIEDYKVNYCIKKDDEKVKYFVEISHPKNSVVEINNTVFCSDFNKGYEEMIHKCDALIKISKKFIHDVKVGEVELN